MKILVTGGAGYIGSHTVRVLQEKGYEVVVYDNLSTGHEWALKNCELVIGDIADTERLKSVFDTHQVAVVVHFAASSLVGESVSNPAKYYENNVVGSKRLLDTMLLKGVNKLVFSSTCATYGLPEVVPITEQEKQCPINSYGWTKFMIERIMQDYGQAYGLNSVALRYFNAAGSAYEAGLGEAHNPESHVIPLLLETVTGKREMFSLFGRDYDTKDGSCIRDYVHVKDLASAHVMALERLMGINSLNDTSGVQAAEQQGFDCFNLGTGEEVSVLQLISVVEKVTGKKVPLRICERREGDPPVLVADNSKALNVLGWKPMHSNIENIVQSAYKWETMKAFCTGDASQIGNRIL
ncbi:UDP-glucose 4-epimerase GalE [Aminipila sp.]|uniref:UDP-glucose 4-epimerase GalE n=1 Tax=Aminipila sp. TaxID=2060095 RepID=UPI002899CB2C|nr:UDP-glucose 4-epimerase GalE [Aminipila sp.]